jgi:small Trp-rich protein
MVGRLDVHCRTGAAGPGALQAGAHSNGLRGPGLTRGARLGRPRRGVYSGSRASSGDTDMWLLWVGVVLLLLWYFDIGVFGELSGWWVAVPFVLAFIWFEVFERRLGLDKKKAFDELDKAKKERIKRTMEQAKNFRQRRM